MPKGGGKPGPKAARKLKGHKLPERFPPGEVLIQTQLAKKKWQLGDVIGQGGFGLIYNAFDITDGPAGSVADYVIKIEPLENGPLFCEMHFYLRAGKQNLIQEWIKPRRLKYLGLSPLFGTGKYVKGSREYRFLVLRRLGTDLHRLFSASDSRFSDKTAFSIGLRMLDVLEYIHEHGYCHADIKAANILLGCNSGHTDYNEVYLVDYGLAYRFMVDGVHVVYREDPKCAHDGTVEYASCDAHKGARPSRRGDLEALGYCMLEWMCGTLPWASSVNKDIVCAQKVQYMNDLEKLYRDCFGKDQCPGGLKRYLAAVSGLAYDERPDYNGLKQCLRSRAGKEWTLGLSEPTSASKGVKRKILSDRPPTPQHVAVKRKRQPAGRSAPSPSPDVHSSISLDTVLPSQPLFNGTSGKIAGKRSKTKICDSKQHPCSSTISEPSTSKISCPSTVDSVELASSSDQLASSTLLPAVTRSTIIPGARLRQRRPAKVKSPTNAKRPTSGPKLQQQPGAVKSVSQKVVVKRKRVRGVPVGHTAVQTSPGLASTDSS